MRKTVPQLLSLHALDRVCAQQRKKPAYLSEKPLSRNKRGLCAATRETPRAATKSPGPQWRPSAAKIF